MDSGLELATPSRIAAEPAPLTTIEWPRHGAKLQAEDGSVAYLVPGVIEAELGPWSRAWVILEYRGGRIATFAALGEMGTWAGATYAWPSEGQR